MKGRKSLIRYITLGLLLILIGLTQLIPSWGTAYSVHLYPMIGGFLSFFSRLIPFAIGDLFIAISIIGIISYPFYAHCYAKKKWKITGWNIVEYSGWIYVWFYLAWGLNYSQPHFYLRTSITPVAYTPENFQRFTDSYLENLNNAYTEITFIDKETVCKEVVYGYTQISDTLGVHAPFHNSPRVKTMLFTSLTSMVGVKGSMGPFFCEFTLNGELPPSQYAATYAHELAHLLGISSEAEANFYAYQVCTRSNIPEIRFGGYFSILTHVLINARHLTTEEEYSKILKQIRPEITELSQANYTYWMEKYSPWLGNVQNLFYDLYLKGNKISNGRLNYSEVVGLLISYEEWKRKSYY